MEYRHIPVTRVSDNHYFESNRKLHKTSTDFKVRLTEANIPAKDWKGNNRKSTRPRPMPANPCPQTWITARSKASVVS